MTREPHICRAHPALVGNMLPRREKSRTRSRRGAPAIGHPSQASDPLWSGVRTLWESHLV
eukprot:8202421-Pyramimonas_sp.AAC.1